jgi:hypothetical protein
MGENGKAQTEMTMRSGGNRRVNICYRSGQVSWRIVKSKEIKLSSGNYQ